MSWGIRITLLYTGFVALIASMVGMAMSQKVDLVSKDYYEQELKYQDRIDALNNSRSLAEPLMWEVKEEVLLLHFPALFEGKPKGGSIRFFRPSDAALDKETKIISDTSATRSIPIGTLVHGAYKMEVSWEAGGKKYYDEGIIQIN